MRRICWTAGLASIGLLLGLKGQDTADDAKWTVLTVLWFACIGYGIGNIFDQKHASKRVIAYWAMTLALVGPLWFLPLAATIFPRIPNLPLGDQAAVGVIGVLFGALFGILFGRIHLRRLRRSTHASESGSAA